jgi:hypothetical protein
MDDRLTREEILSQLQTEYERLQGTLGRMTKVHMTEAGVVGYWSIKDVLAHLIYWNRLPIRELLAALNGETMEYEEGSVDEINARAVAAYREHSLEETRAEFDQSFQEVVGAISGLPDSAFQPNNPLEEAMGDHIAGVFGSNTYEHYPIHERQIRDWIERGGTN